MNDAAQRVSTLWISFLIFGLYLVVSAGTVTHRQLLLEAPVKLPVLNIDLPLVGFFLLAPILFVIFHAYLLLQVVLLGHKAAAYNEAVERHINVAADKVRMRQRLVNALFAQILAGPLREGDAWFGSLLKLVALITVVIAPVLVLLVFELQFLPYHSSLVTWTLRILIVIDLALVFVLWPAAKKTGRDNTLHRVLRWLVASSTAFAVVAFSWVFLSFPGESHAQWTRYYQSEEESKKESVFDIKCLTKSPISMIFASFDRLDLPRVDLVDDEKLEVIAENTKNAGEKDYQGERTLNLRGRNFDCANLSDYADLRRVDLTGTSLRGASLDRSKLQGAILDEAQLQGASSEWAQLQRASLDSAQLQGAFLDSAQLQGAYLGHAELHGASLDWTQLQGASLAGAQLQGASLAGAQLQGASLAGAQLQGAVLGFAQLLGASLVEARLQGAALIGVQLQGADLSLAQLQGADLSLARLQGATLFWAALQGADLLGAALSQTVLSGAFVWRTRNVDCKRARVTGVRVDQVIQFNLRSPSMSLSAKSEIIAKFIDDVVANISNPDAKNAAIERMRAGLIVDPTKDDTEKLADVWRKCKNAAEEKPGAEVDQKRATFLRNLVCNSESERGAIAKGIIRNWIVRDATTILSNLDPESRAFSAQLARGLLGEDGKHCAATADLDEDDMKKLRAAIAAAPKAPPAAPSTPTSDTAPDVAATPSGAAAASSGTAAASSPAQPSAPPK